MGNFWVVKKNGVVLFRGDFLRGKRVFGETIQTYGIRPGEILFLFQGNATELVYGKHLLSWYWVDYFVEGKMDIQGMNIVCNGEKESFHPFSAKEVLKKTLKEEEGEHLPFFHILRLEECRRRE